MYVLVIFFVMRHIYKKGRQPTGVVFCGTLFLYASVRFFNEFLRVDSVPVLGPITLAQATMLCVAAATWLAMGRLSKRGKR
jgi:prolipoprotein diacylglyceryltransferase